jgi:Dehydrogenases with different specificities (related to short-chain alcohol dehydrogenases)
MRTVIVTGASRGLGLAVVERLICEGYHVVAVSRTISAELDRLRVSHSDQLVCEIFDVSDIDGIGDFCRSLLKNFGDIYALVNNAGIGTDGVLATMHQSDIEQIVRTNLLGPIMLTKFLVRPMLRRKVGRVVNISSIIGSTGYHGLAVYGATKAGLEGFTRSLSREIGKRAVTVNCVAPGYMETAMTAALEGSKLDSVRRRAPLGLPTPEQVSGAVSYLLSDVAAAVTGTVITVDGGATA